jgi:hypothetical protein
VLQLLLAYAPTCAILGKGAPATWRHVIANSAVGEGAPSVLSRVEELSVTRSAGKQVPRNDGRDRADLHRGGSQQGHDDLTGDETVTWLN